VNSMNISLVIVVLVVVACMMGFMYVIAIKLRNIERLLIGYYHSERNRKQEEEHQ